MMLKKVFGAAGRFAMAGTGLAVILAAMAVTAVARDSDVPEIDPGSIASAMTLLVGGLLWVTGFRRKK